MSKVLKKAKNKIDWCILNVAKLEHECESEKDRAAMAMLLADLKRVGDEALRLLAGGKIITAAEVMAAQGMPPSSNETF
jgi:hypothetical protein